MKKFKWGRILANIIKARMYGGAVVTVSQTKRGKMKSASVFIEEVDGERVEYILFALNSAKLKRAERLAIFDWLGKQL